MAAEVENEKEFRKLSCGSGSGILEKMEQGVTGKRARETAVHSPVVAMKRQRTSGSTPQSIPGSIDGVVEVNQEVSERQKVTSPRSPQRERNTTPRPISPARNSESQSIQDQLASEVSKASQEAIRKAEAALSMIDGGRSRYSSRNTSPQQAPHHTPNSMSSGESDAQSDTRSRQPSLASGSQSSVSPNVEDIESTIFSRSGLGICGSRRSSTSVSPTLNSQMYNFSKGKDGKSSMDLREKMLPTRLGQFQKDSVMTDQASEVQIQQADTTASTPRAPETRKTPDFQKDFSAIPIKRQEPLSNDIHKLGLLLPTTTTTYTPTSNSPMTKSSQGTLPIGLGSRSSGSIPESSSEGRERSFVPNPENLNTASSHAIPFSNEHNNSENFNFEQRQPLQSSPHEPGHRSGIVFLKQEATPIEMAPSGHNMERKTSTPDQNLPSTQRPGRSESINSTQAQRTLPPLSAVTSPAVTQNQRVYRPPDVVFTLDNRAESKLLTAEVQGLIETFTKSCRLYVKKQDATVSSEIGLIMWQTMENFSKWYCSTTGLAETGTLQFDLIDVNFQLEKTLVVPEGDLNSFRMLKQYTWDLFWVTNNYNSEPALFRVMISKFQGRRDMRKEGSLKPGERHSITEMIRSNSSRSTTPLLEPMVLSNNLTRSPTPGGLLRASQSVQTSPNMKMIASPHLSENSCPTGRNSTSLPPMLPIFRPHNTHRRQSSNPKFVPSKPLYSPPHKDSRSPYEQAMLRSHAEAQLSNRPHLILHPNESTILDKLPYKLGSEVVGCFIDRQSPRGSVMITGKGFITQNIPTGKSELDTQGNRYHEVSIMPKQTCMLHGGATVLYFSKRPTADNAPAPTPTLQTHPQPQTILQQSQKQDVTKEQEVEITIRLQTSPQGHYTPAFPKSVLRPKLSTTDFFTWFASQTSQSQSQSQNPTTPQTLRFIFKDAMPAPKTTTVMLGNEDHFTYLRKDIKTSVEKAKLFCPGIREFVVLVGRGEWGPSTEGEDEEEW